MRGSDEKQRFFRLPSKVKSEKVEASFDKGILKITLPKVEEAKEKQIEIRIKGEKGSVTHSRPSPGRLQNKAQGQTPQEP